MAEVANKHDADCRRRKDEWDLRYFCTCGITDDDIVKDAIWKQMRRELEGSNPPTYTCPLCHG